MNFKKIFLLIATTVLLFACTEEIDVKLGKTYERVAFDGRLTDEHKQHYVKIIKSAGYFSNKPGEPVKNAQVTIADGSTVFNLKEKEPGLYVIDSLQGIVGKTYTMKAVIGNETYVATSEMYYCAPIDSISFEINQFETSKINVKMYGTEPNEKNYYLWQAYEKNHPQDSIKNLTMADDQFFNGKYVSGVVVQDVSAQEGDTIVLEMRSTSQAYFEFIRSIWSQLSEEGGGSPFSGPAANVKGNVSNNALGFFAVYSTKNKQDVVPKLD